jgi:hypothetical protein
MKKIFYYFIILILLTGSAGFAAGCRKSPGKQDDAASGSSSVNSASSSAEGVIAPETEFKVFTRYDKDKKTIFHSFKIPTSWQPAKEKEGFAYAGQEIFYNSEKTKVVFLSLTTIANLQKLGIPDLSEEKNFIVATDKVRKYYENSGIFGKLEQNTKNSFVGDNSKVKAYLSRFYGPVDFSTIDVEPGKLKVKGTKTINIVFLTYENNFCGYYVMVDALSDVKDDENIIAAFVNSLEILKAWE